MNSDKFLTDYSLDNNYAKLLISIHDIRSIIEKLSLNKKIKNAILAVYSQVEFLQKNASLFLQQHPIDQDGKIDLRFLEGSGFYQKIDNYTLYHKGGGSVEALTTGVACDYKNLMFPGFGIEFDAELGTWTYCILGVKKFHQLAWEFLVSFINLIGFVKNNKIYDSNVITANCPIPLCLLTLPELQKKLQNKHANFTENVRKSYHLIESIDQPAKLLLVVPSHIRSTDKYDVPRKWEETQNVFLRTISQNDITLHNMPFNPFYNSISHYIRGCSLRSLLKENLFYEPQSGHLQNSYYIEENKLCSNLADLCDVIPLDDLTHEEKHSLVVNVIGGWRISESLGPVELPNISLGKEDYLEQVSSFFRGLLSDFFDENLKYFYALIPQACSNAVAAVLLTTVPREDNRELINTLLIALPHNELLKEKIIKQVDLFKNEYPSLYKQVTSLRSDAVVSTIYNGLSGKPDKEYYSLLSICKELFLLQTDLASYKFIIYRYLIEFSTSENIKLPETSDIIKQPWVYFEKFFLKKTSRLYKENVLSVGLFIKEHMDEFFYLSVPIIKAWILENVFSGRLDAVQKWLLKLSNILQTIDPIYAEFLDCYLIFIFKRKNMYDFILSCKSTEQFDDKINGWDKKANPIVRKYPSFFFNEPKKQKIEMSWDIIVHSIIQAQKSLLTLDYE